MRWIARSVGFLPKRTILVVHRGMLGLQAWGDGLNGILFEFLDDDTKLAQSCRNWLYVQHWYVVAPDHVESCKKKHIPRVHRHVCPAQASQTVKKQRFFGRGGREGGWPQMESTQGDFCAHAWTRARRATDRDFESVSASFCVNAWICAARSTDRDLDFCVNAWTCPRRATDRDLESVSASFCVNAWIWQMSFSIKSVTSVMSVMSVIFMRTYCFRMNVNP